MSGCGGRGRGGSRCGTAPAGGRSGFARARGGCAWPSPRVTSTLFNAATLPCGTTVETPAPGRTSERDAARAIEPCARSVRPGYFAASRSCPEASVPSEADGGLPDPAHTVAAGPEFVVLGSIAAATLVGIAPSITAGIAPRGIVLGIFRLTPVLALENPRAP